MRRHVTAIAAFALLCTALVWIDGFFADLVADCSNRGGAMIKGYTCIKFDAAIKQDAPREPE